MSSSQRTTPADPCSDSTSRWHALGLIGKWQPHHSLIRQSRLKHPDDRTLIVRQLKGLSSVIGVAVVHPYMGPEGWTWTVPDEYDNKLPGVVKDPLYGFQKIRQLYFKAQEDYGARFTVPVLWDSKEETIVNNESSEIIRIFNHEVSKPCDLGDCTTPLTVCSV